MTTPRQQLSAALDLPATVTVVPYGTMRDSFTGPTVMVFTDQVDPAPAGGRDLRVYTFAVLVVGSKVSDLYGDVELDAALEDVLYAIARADNVTWTGATRQTYRDTHPCYRVAVQVFTNHTEP